jgi:hypothetical protein
MSGHPNIPDPGEAGAAMLAGFRAAAPAVRVTCPKCGFAFAPPGQLERATESAPAVEASIDGKRSFADIREMVRDALRARISAASGGGYAWVVVADLTDTDVVYTTDGVDGDELYQCSYTADDAGTVTLGTPAPVVRTYAPAPGGVAVASVAVDGMVEARATLPGRILEAKGTAADGGRVFGTRIIAYGDSANGRRYPEAVMRAAAGLYEGAKAYDRHRGTEELRSSTIAGLVGYYRNVEATPDGLEADLHLLPSASHAAEALDASLTLAAEGLTPLIGVSHDVMATFKPISEAGRRLQEATAIVRVLSADLVSDPAAGGKAVRMVAGGIDTDPPAQRGTETQEDPLPVAAADVLAALGTATPEQLAAVGLAKAGTPTIESVTPPAAPEPAREAGEPKTGFLAQWMIATKVKAAGLPEKAVEAVAAALPERVAEADIDAQIAAIKTALGVLDIPAPGHTAQVTQESVEKKVKALDAMFAGNYREGYRSFRQAFTDITGRQPRSWDEDFSRTILRESMGRPGEGYSSAERASESLTVSSWDVILGDSITRRMVAEYGRPSLGTWRNIVSSVVPVNDFRTQRIDRLGGYGTLPAVNAGAPYQPLTSPGDEEATYSITKRGGTEDLTLEMIADDDLRAIQKIPTKLGLAAAQTLYRFVWDILPTNAAVTYDSVALFHASHSNTTASAVLTQANLSTLRTKMRQQTAYGDTSDVLSVIPRYLVVPSALEEIAYQLANSAVAIPASGNASNIPNIHQTIEPMVIDYYSDTNDWYIVCDPAMCPTIEVGFWQGREDPELFTQSDPTVGSMFDADKLTWKIRHVYSGAVLDHRGFQRATN